MMLKFLSTNSGRNVKACYITSVSMRCIHFIHTSYFDNVSLCLSPQGTSGNDGPGGPPGERVSIRYVFNKEYTVN